MSIRRFIRLGGSAALSVIAVLGFASNAPAASATLTLNPTHEVASAAGNFFDATFYVDTCFTGMTARIFWRGPAPIASIVDPPCSGQTMTVFFRQVPGPGPTPGYTTYMAGLWADSDIHNLQAYVSAQAVFRMDAPPPPPSVNPGPLPPGHVGPPAGPPPATVVPSPPPPQVSPTATPCPVLTAAITQGSTNPIMPVPQSGLMFLVAVLLGTGSLMRAVRHRRTAALLLLIVVSVVTMSCGRYPPNAVGEASSPTASQLAPSPSQLAPSPSPTC